MNVMPRCFWCNDDPLYIAYHDEEWGVPLRDADRLLQLFSHRRKSVQAVVRRAA